MNEPLHPDEVLRRLRYMGRQYSAGQYARGGGQSKHYLEEAADPIESLTAENAALKAEVEGLRADAERLNWLEARASSVHRQRKSKKWSVHVSLLSSEYEVFKTLREAIDAARAGDGK